MPTSTTPGFDYDRLSCLGPEFSDTFLCTLFTSTRNSCKLRRKKNFQWSNGKMAMSKMAMLGDLIFLFFIRDWNQSKCDKMRRYD